MTAVIEPTNAKGLNPLEQEWVDQFMDDTTLFLGPDPEIMRSHHITERSEFEDECISNGIDPLEVDRITSAPAKKSGAHTGDGVRP